MREKEKSKNKIDRVEGDMGKLTKINRVLITTNDMKERVIAQLKEELAVKNEKLEDL